MWLFEQKGSSICSQVKSQVFTINIMKKRYRKPTVSIFNRETVKAKN